MEERKIDKTSLIGMLLISIIFGWYMMSNSQEQTDTQETETTVEQKVASTTTETGQDFGDFNYGQKNISENTETKISNNFLNITFSNKGGFISNIELKNQHRISKDNKELVQLIKDNNSNLNLKLQTKDNRVLNTKDLMFEPVVTKEGDNQIVSMKLKTSESTYVEYKYTIKPDDYMMDFSIRTVGLGNALNTSVQPVLEWDMKTIRNEKSISYENRYTEVVYEYEGGKDTYLSAAGNDNSEEKEVTYVAFKQHLFTSILLTDKAFKTAKMWSEDLVQDEEKDNFTKQFRAEFPLEYQSGELSQTMNFYFGPADYQILNKYNRNLDEILSLGWGIFGWMNKFVFIPLFGLLTDLIPHGIAIIIFTILVKILMSPIQYKSYVSQAKMRIIRPEVEEINKKYANDAMKKQQETMALYSKAGVNPMAGCLPMFIQIPVFYALFSFFPAAFDLRQVSFLWADDLSSYDNIATLPFSIPFYGNHISLFPMLAAIATFIYMKMTTSDQASTAPTQEGMPDMSKIMKIMIYVSPIMMLFFFNNYASGLSLYYFISNVITIGIMYVIKNKIVTEDKVHQIIANNRSKEKPKSKFQRKMEELMEQAQKQKELNKKN